MNHNMTYNRLSTIGEKGGIYQRQEILRNVLSITHNLNFLMIDGSSRAALMA